MAVVTVVFYRQYPISSLLVGLGALFEFGWPTAEAAIRHAKGLAAGLGICLGSMGVGLFFTARLAPGLSALGRVVLAGILGLGITAYTVLALGWLQLYQYPVLALLWTLLVAAFIVAFWTHRRTFIEPALDDLMITLRHSSPVVLFLLAVLTGVSFLMAFVPEIFYDSTVYHTGVPHWYLQEGGIRKFPNLHSNYPLTIQMLYLLGLGLNGDAAAKLIHWFCGVLIALGFLAWSKEEGEHRAGGWAALAFLSMPMTAWSWWTTGNDVGVSMLALAAAWSWYRAISLAEGTPRTGLLALSAVFAGLCFSSKLTAGPVIGILGFCHLIWGVLTKRSLKTLAIEGLTIGLASFLVCLPWLAKAYVFTGNPVFPFLSKFFGGLDPERTSRFYAESQGFTPKLWWEFLSFPWFLTFKTHSSLSFMGPFILSALPLSFYHLFFNLLSSRHPATGRDPGPTALNLKLVFLFGLLGCLALVFVNRLTRYWMPYFVVLLFPMGWACLRSVAASPWASRFFHFLTMVMGATGILIVIQTIGSSYQPWPVLLGQEKPREYQAYSHPGMYPYPAVGMFNWAKDNLPPNSKLLILGDEKVAACDVPFLAAGVYDVALPQIWARTAKTTPEFYDRVRQEGITHILVNLMEGKRLSGYGIFDFSEDTLALFCDFWDKHVRILKEDAIPEKFFPGRPPLFLYNILPETEAARTPAPPNPVLWIHEETKVSANEPDMIVKKIDFYRDLAKKYPQVAAFGQKLKVLENFKAQSEAQMKNQRKR